jgi:hypothetical protein
LLDSLAYRAVYCGSGNIPFVKIQAGTFFSSSFELGGEERTQREIAKELGISRSYVSRIKKRALMKQVKKATFKVITKALKTIF